MKKTHKARGYEVWIYPNWGLSRPDLIYSGPDKEAAKDIFYTRELGGLGNVVTVTLREDGVAIMTRRYRGE